MNNIERAKIKAGTRGETRADYLHSSGYAKAQSGSKIGVSSLQSFKDRQILEGNRRYVRSYRESKMGTQADNNKRAWTSDKSADFARRYGRGIFGSGATAETTNTVERTPVSAKQRNPIAERRGK